MWVPQIREWTWPPQNIEQKGWGEVREMGKQLRQQQRLEGWSLKVRFKEIVYHPEFGPKASNLKTKEKVF